MLQAAEDGDQSIRCPATKLNHVAALAGRDQLPLWVAGGRGSRALLNSAVARGWAQAQRWRRDVGLATGDQHGSDPHAAPFGAANFTEGLGKQVPAGDLWTVSMRLTFSFALLGVQASPSFSVLGFSCRDTQGFAGQPVWATGAIVGLVLLFFATADTPAAWGAWRRAMRGRLTPPPPPSARWHRASFGYRPCRRCASSRRCRWPPQPASRPRRRWSRSMSKNASFAPPPMTVRSDVSRVQGWR